MVEYITNDINNTSQSLSAHWNTNGVASIENLLSTYQTLSTIHGNGAHSILSQMLSHFENQTGRTVVHLQGVQNRWQVLIELHVHNGTNYGNDFSIRSSGSLSSCLGGMATSCMG